MSERLSIPQSVGQALANDTEEQCSEPMPDQPVRTGGFSGVPHPLDPSLRLAAYSDLKQILADMLALGLDAAIDDGAVGICAKAYPNEGQEDYEAVDELWSSLNERLESAGYRLVDGESDNDSVCGTVERLPQSTHVPAAGAATDAPEGIS